VTQSSEGTETSVVYELEWRYPTCFDDGGWSHDLGWDTSKATLDAATDELARQIAWGEKFNHKEYCRHGRKSYPFRLTKVTTEQTIDGWKRVTRDEIPLRKD